MATINSVLSPLVLLESGITLYPSVESVLTKGRLPDVETKSTGVTRGPDGTILTTDTRESTIKNK